MAEVLIPEEYETDPYLNLLPKQALIKAKSTENQRLLLGLPVTGLVRVEFMFAKEAASTPTNWSLGSIPYRMADHTAGPLGYNVMDARNVIAHHAVQQGYEWLFFLDHDVIVPMDIWVKLNAYMRDGTTPLVSGLYFTKSVPAEPLVYRGRGNSYYGDFAIGDKVWADGCGCGCLLINVKLLKAMAADAPLYLAGGNQQVRKIFETPQFVWVDPETGTYNAHSGTEDLSWFDRIVQGKYLAKAGFKDIAKKKYFILVDTSIFCMHITQDGVQYPLELKW